MKINRPRVSRTKSGSYQVYFRTSGQSIRRRFATRAEAELVAQQLMLEAVSDQTLQTRLVQTWLSDEQLRRSEAYWSTRPAPGRSKLWKDLQTEYLAELERRGSRPRTVANATSTLTAVDLRDPLPYLTDPKVAPTTIWSRYRYLHAFFAWAERNGGPPNPIKGFQLPRVTRALPAVLTPGEARLLIRQAARVGMKWYYGLCLFSGLRPDEAKAFDDAWVGNDCIQIPPTFSKVHQVRTMPLHENLTAILEEDRAPWKRHRDKQARAGIPWQLDIGRHSYASYRLVLDGDLERLALHMGNSPAVLRRHYLRQTVSRSEAEDYFSIR